MINPKELRIGNWVLIENHPHKIAWFKPNDNETKITDDYIIGFFSKFGSVWEIDSNDPFDSIPLTPEILEKAGFDKDLSLSSDYYRLRNSLCKMAWSNKFSFYLPYFSMSTYTGSIIIKSVHQLQNLYFALTGEELEIKL
jgi:hypothetical protein